MTFDHIKRTSGKTSAETNELHAVFLVFVLELIDGTWTRKVCRILAFYSFWGIMFTYFWGFRLRRFSSPHTLNTMDL